MYWRLKSIPELRDLPPTERRRLWREAISTPLRPLDLFWLIAIFAPVVPMVWLLIYIDSKLAKGWKHAVVTVGVLLAYQQVAFFLFALRSRPALRRLRGEGNWAVANASWLTPSRHLCIIGAAIWILATPMMLGKYLDVTSRTWQGMVFGTISLAAGAAFFVAAGRSAWLARRKEYRETHSLCTQCGYDLRSSPDRCPECGNTPLGPT
jgi:hypothetical protein